MRTPGLQHPVHHSVHPPTEVRPHRAIEAAPGRPLGTRGREGHDRWPGWRVFSARRGLGSRATTDAVTGRRPAGRGQPEEASTPGVWDRIRDATYAKTAGKASRQSRGTVSEKRRTISEAGWASETILRLLRCVGFGLRTQDSVRASHLGFRYLPFRPWALFGFRALDLGISARRSYLFRTRPMRVAAPGLPYDRSCAPESQSSGIATTASA